MEVLVFRGFLGLRAMIDAFGESAGFKGVVVLVIRCLSYGMVGLDGV